MCTVEGSAHTRDSQTVGCFLVPALDDLSMTVQGGITVLWDALFTHYNRAVSKEPGKKQIAEPHPFFEAIFELLHLVC